MSQVDELFGGGEGQPGARLGRVYGLLVAGLLIGTLGLVCSVVPGAALVLIAWLMAEKELDRVESGYLPKQLRPTVSRAHRLTRAGLVSLILLLFLQVVLLCAGVYHRAWEALLAYIRSLGG